MDNLITPNADLLIVVILGLTVLLGILFVKTKPKITLKVVLITLLISVWMALLSGLIHQESLAGTGIYTRNGWPIAYIESGNWNIFQFFVTCYFYFLITASAAILLIKKKGKK